MSTVSIIPARRRIERVSASRPLYELRARGLPRHDLDLSVWELPSEATPRLAAPECVGSLHGNALALLENRLTRRLKEAGIRVGALRNEEERSFELDEDQALVLALLFRALAPMRSVERMRQVAEGIDRLSREEAGYWLGMAIHRRYPRRVLASLRLLLTAT